MPTHPFCRRPGVTLTEIVVVIAIILVLASLSFVAFSSAKNFADRTEHATQTTVMRVHRTAKGTMPPIYVGPALPGPPRPERYPGHYFVAFRAAVANPQAEAHRLAALVEGRVVGVYVHGVRGCGLACTDKKAALLAGDS